MDQRSKENDMYEDLCQVNGSNFMDGETKKRCCLT